MPSVQDYIDLGSRDAISSCVAVPISRMGCG